MNKHKPNLLAVLLVALLIINASACCAKGTIPTGLCKLSDTIVDCTKESLISAGPALASEADRIIRAGGSGVDSALEKLIEVAGDAGICAIAHLPALFASKPASGPEELARRTFVVTHGRDFLATRKIKAKVNK